MDSTQKICKNDSVIEIRIRFMNGVKLKVTCCTGNEERRFGTNAKGKIQTHSQDSWRGGNHLIQGLCIVERRIFRVLYGAGPWAFPSCFNLG